MDLIILLWELVPEGVRGWLESVVSDPLFLETATFILFLYTIVWILTYYLRDLTRLIKLWTKSQYLYLVVKRWITRIGAILLTYYIGKMFWGFVPEEIQVYINNHGVHRDEILVVLGILCPFAYDGGRWIIGFIKKSIRATWNASCKARGAPPLPEPEEDTGTLMGKALEEYIAQRSIKKK